MPRKVYEIARDIRKEWKNVYFGAVPYLDAMSSIGDINESYGADSAESVAIYFLANANTFRGPEAKLLKAELKCLASKYCKPSKAERELVVAAGRG